MATTTYYVCVIREFCHLDDRIGRPIGWWTGRQWSAVKSEAKPFSSHSAAIAERLIADSKLGISSPPLFPMIWDDSVASESDVPMIGISNADAIDPCLKSFRHARSTTDGAGWQVA